MKWSQKSKKSFYSGEGEFFRARGNFATRGDPKQLKIWFDVFYTDFPFCWKNSILFRVSPLLRLYGGNLFYVKLKKEDNLKMKMTSKVKAT